MKHPNMTDHLGLDSKEGLAKPTAGWQTVGWTVIIVSMTCRVYPLSLQRTPLSSLHPPPSSLSRSSSRLPLCGLLRKRASDSFSQHVPGLKQICLHVFLRPWRDFITIVFLSLSPGVMFSFIFPLHYFSAPVMTSLPLCSYHFPQGLCSLLFSRCIQGPESVSDRHLFT